MNAKTSLITSNILAVCDALAKDGDANAAKGLKSYKVREKPYLLIPLGPEDGASFVSGWTRGGAYTAKLKVIASPCTPVFNVKAPN